MQGHPLNASIPARCDYDVPPQDADLTLVGAIDAGALAASRSRHPSSHIDRRLLADACASCGFVAPMRRRASASLRALPAAWARHLARNPELLEAAAILRDELHAVTNRVERVLSSPGSTLSRVRVDAPSALARAASCDLLVELLHIECERLAQVIDAIHAEQWDLLGNVDAVGVRVADLVAVPLHHSHRTLSGAGATSSARVVLNRVPDRTTDRWRKAPSDRRIDGVRSP